MMCSYVFKRGLGSGYAARCYALAYDDLKKRGGSMVICVSPLMIEQTAKFSLVD